MSSPYGQQLCPLAKFYQVRDQGTQATLWIRDAKEEKTKSTSELLSKAVISNMTQYSTQPLSTQGASPRDNDDR